jgi:sugar phosphate isomerase/epimerase
LATGVAAGALALSGTAWAGKSGKNARWKRGLGLNGFQSSGDVFKKTYPLWEILDFAADTGFDGVELVDNWPMGGYPSADETKRVDALKRLYSAYGLRIYSIQTFGSGSYSADPAARCEWLKMFRERVRLCEKLGCAFVGNWPGGGLEGNADVNAAIDRLASTYREAAQMCADAGMHMSFEIEPPFVFNTLEHLQRILAAVDHPACKTNYDPSHFDLMTGGKGKPEEMLRKLGVQHIGHVHLTDCDGTIFNGTSHHLPCGEGHCDVAASLDVLWEGGYEGWLMIDAWMTEDAYVASRKGIEAIDAAIARHRKA